jgi:hypothetical protein
MAFQRGSSVNPALGRTDFTPFLQGSLAGSQMAAQGAAAMGQGIGALAQGAAQGVRSYYDNKKKKEEEQAAVTFLEGIAKTNPATAQAIGLAPGQDGKFDPAAIKAAIKGAGGPAQAVKLGLLVQQQQQVEEQQRQQQEILAQQMQAAQQKAAADAAAAQRQQMVGAGANAVAMGGNVPSYYTNEMANEATLAGRKRAAELAKLQKEAAPPAPPTPNVGVGRVYDPATGSAKVIPGGEADVKQQEKAAEAQKEKDELAVRAEATRQTLGQTLTLVRQAIDAQSKAGGTIGGQVAGSLPSFMRGLTWGSEVGDVLDAQEALYEQINARNTLGALLQLTSDSPGGNNPLSPLSNKDAETLAATVGNLRVSRDEKVQLKTLRDIDKLIAEKLGIEPLKTTSKREPKAPQAYNPAMSVPSSGALNWDRANGTLTR